MNNNILIIDGTLGGGQILRTALSLSLITQKPFKLYNIRKGRSNPGLQFQHLTCITSIISISNSKCIGAYIGSTYIEFYPKPVNSGNYSFNIGTAGSVNLLLQCLTYPLAFLETKSIICIKGGTHVNFSPTFEYITNIWIPSIKQYGINVEVKLIKPGLYPKGGGEIHAIINDESIEKINLSTWFSDIKEYIPISYNINIYHTNLDINNILDNKKYSNEIFNINDIGKSRSTGLSILLIKKFNDFIYGDSYVFSKKEIQKLDHKKVIKNFIDENQNIKTIDEYLSDQILLPAALSSIGKISKRDTIFVVKNLTNHFNTHINVINSFIDFHININNEINNTYTIIIN